MMHWHDGLAPGHGREQDELCIGGVRASELAHRYGTPLLVLDYNVLDEAIEDFRQAAARYDIDVAYAGKALLLVGLAKHLKRTSLKLDVSSLGELATAERAAFPPDRIAMHGCGKTDAELSAAAQGRAGSIIVDNIDELHRLRTVSTSERAIGTLLRLNTGIEAHTHEFVRTSGANTKFGFDPPGLSAALSVLQSAPNLQFLGLHAHIGSQIFEERAFLANVQALMERAAYCASAGFPCRHIIVGGGFGVQMHPNETSVLDLSKTLGAIRASVEQDAHDRRIPVPRIGIEPGRAIIAHAGTSLYRIMSVKSAFGRRYVIVDGGVYENPRPALYDAYHHVVSASRNGTETVRTAICGRTCENDELGAADLPAGLRAGDLLAMCTTGAYTFSMASNYNRFARPAVAAVRDGTHRLLARREQIEDVLRNDCDA